MTLGDDLEKLLGEQFTDWQKELHGDLRIGINTDPLLSAPINVRVQRGYVQVSRELLDETYRAPAPAHLAPWRKRARWRWQAWRHVAGLKIGGLIAGFDLSHDDCE